MALVSNELLAFVQHVVNTMDEDSIVQLCRSTYTSEEICKGRLMLYEALGKTAQMTSRRRDGSERSLQDIISLLKQTNPAELPVFVAKQLHKLPAVSTDHVNVSSLLQKFNIMRAELDEMRGRLDASETTISYGHIAPKTTYGRVATIIYAIIGIPLFLIVLADFGKLFTRIIKFFWAYIRRFYYTRSCRRVRRTGPVQEVMKGLNIVYEVVRRPSQVFSEEDIEIAGPPVERKTSDAPPPLPPKPGVTREVEVETDPGTPAPSVFEIDDEFNLPISVAIFILVVYIIIGAIGYNMWETWSFFESFYFVFISMSTIGLGDLVPDHPMFMMASILYLVFGLALTSMCINVVQVKLSDTFRQASAKLGATIGLKVAEEDGSLVPITPPPVEIPPVHKPNNIEESKIKGEETKEDAKNR